MQSPGGTVYTIKRKLKLLVWQTTCIVQKLTTGNKDIRMYVGVHVLLVALFGCASHQS